MPHTADFDLDRLGDIPDPLQGRVASIQAAPSISGVVSPGRAVVRGRRWGALLLSLLWVMGNLAVYGFRTDWGELPTPFVAIQVVTPYLLALVVLTVALHRGRFGLGLGRSWLMGMTLAGPLTFVLLAMVGPSLYPEALQNSALDRCAMCFNLTMAWATAPLLLAGITLRRAFASGVGWRAALVGVSCGLLAGGTMNLHCANVDSVHVMVGHGIPTLITTVLGAAVLARWARA